jgi:hypothetical protein
VSGQRMAATVLVRALGELLGCIALQQARRDRPCQQASWCHRLQLGEVEVDATLLIEPRYIPACSMADITNVLNWVQRCADQELLHFTKGVGVCRKAICQ